MFGNMQHSGGLIGDEGKEISQKFDESNLGYLMIKSTIFTGSLVFVVDYSDLSSCEELIITKYKYIYNEIYNEDV